MRFRCRGVRRGGQFALLTALLALCLIPALVLASDIQTAGKMFLLGAGARSDGLGGCGTLIGEATSGLFNPAAQTLNDDLGGIIFSNPRPYFQRGYDFLVLSAAAHTEFGYIGANFLSRRGVIGGDKPPEEGSALVLAGRAWRGLAVGLALKILSTRKADFPFADLNENPAKTYKTIFDFGVLYAGLLPQATLGRVREAPESLKAKFGRSFKRGLATGIAFQNLGGHVKYDYDNNIEMLPQMFRADLMWAAFENNTMDLRVMGEVQKLLVRLNAAGGYDNATSALFKAWGTSSREGGWTARCGAEANFYGLLSARFGWSADYSQTRRTFNHIGLGLGPEWLRVNIAFVHEPKSDYAWWDGLRLDASANVSFDQVRSWMSHR